MQFECEGLLFDLDGTLVNSLPAVERVWSWFAGRHGLNKADVLHRIHGRRSEDSIRLFAPHLDISGENALLVEKESQDTEGVEPVGGAIEFLLTLPPESWGIVTSGTSPVAKPRIAAAGLPIPAVIVTGEELENGKPAPDCFLLGAKRLGISPENCLAFEDTEAGIAAARNAGMKVIGISAVGGSERVQSADAVTHDYRSISVSQNGSRLIVSLSPDK